MNEENTVSARPLGFAALLAVSFGLFNVGFIIEQTLRWSDPLQGFLSGLKIAYISAVGWAIFVLPWSLMIAVMYRWQKWQRYRTYWILAPSFVMACLLVASLVIESPRATSRFVKFTQSTLPEKRQNFRSNLTGGGFVDYLDTYYFETTPEEFERLRVEMQLSLDDLFDPHKKDTTEVALLPEWPDYRQWITPVQYYVGLPSGMFCYLITDASKTKVYIATGTP